MAFNQNDNSFEVALATKMQLILDQPMSDVSTGLVNHDFEGDFFKIGNTVSVVKPDPESVRVEVGQAIETATGRIGTPVGNTDGDTFTLDSAGLSNNSVDDPANVTLGVNDARLQVRDLTFTKQTLVIDKCAKYAFAVSDITEAEGKWNYESGGLDLAGYRMRKAHNIETMNMILADANIEKIGTAANPITLSTADGLYEDIILEMFAKLYDNGAITADGQVTFGSNAQEGKQTYGQIYIPTKLYTMLLKSKYLTDRSTVAADEKVQTGKVKTITNLDVNIEPALKNSTTASINHVTVPNADGDTFCIIAGTKNLVTRAGKVLPPDKIRSVTRFADEYHGMEIYGEKVFSPKSAVVAFVKLGE